MANIMGDNEALSTIDNALGSLNNKFHAVYNLGYRKGKEDSKKEMADLFKEFMEEHIHD